MGAMNLGNVNPFNAPASMVSTPTEGVSGTQTGRPPATGGMAVGPTDQTGRGSAGTGTSGQGTSDAPSPTGMTDAGEASAALGNIASGAQQGGMNFGLNAAGVNPTISSLASNLAGTLAGLSGFGLGFKGLNALGGAIANGLQGSPTRGGDFSGVNFGNNVPSSVNDYSGTNASLSDTGRGLADTDPDAVGNPSAPFSLMDLANPDASIASGPAPSPNMGLFSGPADMGFPSTYSGIATGVGTGNPSPHSTNFGATPPAVEVVDDPTEGNTGNEGESGGVGPAGAGPAAGASSSSGVGTGAGVSGAGIGEGEGGPGPGDGSGPGGDGGGGASGGGDGAMRKGGRVRRPDPVKLANMLKAGAKVPVGSKRPGADDVGVRLSRGEEVVNKKATDVFGPILEQMNRWGNRQGGFGVGQDQTGRPRMARR